MKIYPQSLRAKMAVSAILIILNQNYLIPNRLSAANSLFDGALKLKGHKRFLHDKYAKCKKSSKITIG